MPRPRSNHHQVSHNLPIPQPSHQASMMYSPPKLDPQVQRSQGVIFLSSNKPQIPATPQPPILPPQAHMGHHQVNQVPAHNTSMFQPQHVPAFVPPGLMQNPFFPYYHFPTAAPTAVPTSNEVYTPNGASSSGGGYDDSMQIPPQPLKTKPKRRSRYTADSESDSSSEAEFNDDEEDPDWAPATDNEPQEPTFESRRGAPRGRRSSTTPRGRGGRGRGSRGGGRGRGRGRGRGGSDFGMQRSDTPPTLVNQQAHFQGQIAGRQTRSTINMPSLDPQSGHLSFGELVSAAVNSLNEPVEDDYTSSHHKRQKSLMAAVIMTQPDKVVNIERVPVSTPANMFVPVNLTERIGDKENKDELALVAEDEDLIMTYEIVQDEDKQRPFMCEICGKESRSRVLHNRHLVTHAPSSRFACCICSHLFESHEKLKPHLRMHHGSGIFVCPEIDCEGVFSERKSLDDHDFACHPNARPFACRFCLDRFPTTAEATAHEDAHDEEITASCLKCSATYKTKTDLKNHYSHMHEEKQCKFCEKKLENQPALDDHLNEAHEEEMKPPPEPTPEPSPEPLAPADDDEPMASPAGGNDDDDEIMVVEERKKETPLKSNKKSEPRKSKGPEQKTTPKPGPKLKPVPKLKPIVRSKPTTPASNDIITLSSDSEDEKDPEWSPGSKKSRKSFIPVLPVKRSSRRKAEYVVIVESRTEETANDVLKKSSKSTNQPLTFVMNDSGELVHVPTSSDPHPPDSLPIKEIMDVIKRKNLKDNTTIVIEDNKITSVKPSNDSQKTTPLSRVTNSRHSPASKWVRPSATESTSSHKVKPSTSSARISEQSNSQPPKLVAKKRTGGLPRTDRHEREKRHFSETSSSSDTDKVKPKPAAGPIARKRTGGSSSVYDSMKHKSDKIDLNEVRREKQPRKDTHEIREDFDTPVIIEERGSSHKTLIPLKVPIKSSSSSSHSHKHKKNSKRGRKKGRSKSPSYRELQPVTELVDYDNAPKRSLRIALKASVTDGTSADSPASVELDDPIADDDDFYPSTSDPLSIGPKKRGRPSSSKTNLTTTPSTNNSFLENATSAASNGQVVMKALVNGKWQDVVIGTKLGTEQSEPVQAPAFKLPTPKQDKIQRPINAKKSTGGSKKTTVPPGAKITSGSRGGKRGRKGKNSKKSADCWRDDRYQYFSDGSRQVGTPDPSLYSMTNTIAYKDDPGVEYSDSQDYGTDDTVLPFSLSSYMTYHEDEPRTEEHEPEPDDQEDQGFPVILNAYHVADTTNRIDNYHESYTTDHSHSANMYKEEPNNMHEVDETEEVDEIPLRDPLAMDDGPIDDTEEAMDEDPLGCPEPVPQPPKPPIPVVTEPKKGTVQEAKSAISNLRSVLSQITFKR